jgi:hypothetical protein
MDGTHWNGKRWSGEGHTEGHTQSRPKNRDRSMPSATFSLRPHHLDAIREAACHRQTSHSEVVRQALDVALKGQPMSPSEPGVANLQDQVQKPAHVGLPMPPLAKELAAIRRELMELRHAIVRQQVREDMVMDCHLSDPEHA